MILKKFKYWLLFGGTFLLIKLLSSWEWFTHFFFPKKWYPLVQQFWQWLSFVPFSVGDVLYFVLIVYLFREFVLVIQSQKRRLISLLKKTPLILSIGCFWFYFNWGFLYHQKPMYETLGYEQTLEIEGLKNLAQILIDQTNKYHLEVTNQVNEQINWKDQKDINDLLIQEYNFSFKINNQLLKPKPSLWSWVLSYMGFTGYLNPFTLEAQYNYLPPKDSHVFTKSHEMAHQLGYASESETNFAAFLNCIKNESPKIKYAGYITATKYVLSMIKAFDEEGASIYLEQLNKGVHKDLEESKIYSEKYNTIIDNVSHWWYDQFLKINEQEDGIESYQGLVFYLVNYYAMDI